MTRAERRRAFLSAHGIAEAALEPLAQDASARRYFRLTDRGMLLMDAPPPGEKPEAFLRITGHLAALGARVPAIHASDADEGFILLEDLGDRTFTRLLDGGEDAHRLYRLATDELAAMQRHCAGEAFGPALGHYDAGATLDEVALFVDWYLPARLGRAMSGEAREAFLGLWSRAFNALPPMDPVLVHRDFHVDNLLLVADRCALIDYQDALLGSPVYDLVSLLEDARRDVDPALRETLITRWRSQLQPAAEVFGRQYAFWGAQRHCKVAGIFVRLWRRDDKPGYLRHLDRVMSLLSESLERSPELLPIKQWIVEHLGTVSHDALGP